MDDERVRDWVRTSEDSGAPQESGLLGRAPPSYQRDALRYGETMEETTPPFAGLKLGPGADMGAQPLPGGPSAGPVL